jgi:hypothetical protein
MRAHETLLWLVVAGSIAGCASASSSAATEMAGADAPSCNVPTPAVDGEPWREVRATSFTFCVPGNWRPSGSSARGIAARTWRGGSGSVTWGTGEYRPRRVVTTTVVVRPGEPLPSTPPGQVRRFTETIDNRTAQLWDNEINGRHYTGATWSRPTVFFDGESADAATARVQLAVYRTVRFTGTDSTAHR